MSRAYLKSLNPIWNEVILLHSMRISGKIAPITVRVLDQDQGFLSKSYEFLGHCSFRVAEEK